MELSDKLLHECQRLLYSEWCEAFDNLKKVKGEVNDGSPDWTLFHAHRLKAAELNLETSKHLLDEINPFAPLTRNKMNRRV